MMVLLAFLVGVLVGVGVYLVLQGSLARFLLGLALLSNAANLVVFLSPGLVRGHSPIIPLGAKVLEPPYADPLPQAMILTAIVIGLGVLAFAVVLAYRVHQVLGTDDLDELRGTDR
ncbi:MULTISPECIES: NADH-quinone oxidoreductase subunit K [Thermus]|uniref:NADH-quinone oxidoreductase subunit K n=1 Tax=Thermus TaxID=270 RepID=UPI00035D5AFA|nr:MULTISPECIES: NADH-quinone oxidoreductase subunit K [Thermus]ULR40367.1 NADH-quinone oxidoreductase subunit K [Thermus sp. NEB1569]